MWFYFLCRDAMQLVFGAIALLAWIAGAVIAKGFWSTFFTIFFFPYAWYLVVEKYLIP